MDRQTWIRIAGILGFLGVTLGAFGAHGLKEMLERGNALQTWETAVFYHLSHGVALLAVSLAAAKPQKSAVWFLAGVILFSGSLYILALTGVKWLGMVTPLGGLCFLVGWSVLIFGGQAVSR